MLICRKKAAFKGEILNVFVVFEKYVLTSNGHVYLVDEMTKRAKCKPTGTYEEMVTFQLGVIATMLTDISKSLAIFADKVDRSEEE